jgi:hypothetical protein
MTKEKRNTAIMDKIERYTQHHTATPDLAQEAIERIAMANHKDSAEYIKLLNEVVTLRWKCGAQAAAIATLRQPTQSDVQIIANERKAIAAWLRGEVDTDYTDPEFDIGRNLADAVERGAYIQEQSK